MQLLADLMARPASLSRPSGYTVMNGVIYRRSGKMFFWLTDDERRLPVRVRMQMSLFFGTVTIDLVKEDRS